MRSIATIQSFINMMNTKAPGKKLMKILWQEKKLRKAEYNLLKASKESNKDIERERQLFKEINIIIDIIDNFYQVPF